MSLPDAGRCPEAEALKSPITINTELHRKPMPSPRRKVLPAYTARTFDAEILLVGIKEPPAHGKRHRMCPVVGPQFGEDVLDMPFDSIFGDR